MSIRELFKISRGTRVVMMITTSVSVLAIIFAFFYYRSINRSEDPRIKGAKEWLMRYEKISGSYNSLEAFSYLDSAKLILMSYPDYRSSFEIGLIHNNKCSVLLMMALYDSTLAEAEKESLLDLAMKYCDSSIMVYNKWIKNWGDVSSDIIADRIRPDMNKEDPSFNNMNFNKIFSKRVINIALAQIETPRRLSVSLGNKGTIYRHLLEPDSALIFYKQALSLWKDNRTAKSNLSVLVGNDPIKPSIIETLFPPDKNKK